MFEEIIDFWFQTAKFFANDDIHWAIVFIPAIPAFSLIIPVRQLWMRITRTLSTPTTDISRLQKDSEAEIKGHVVQFVTDFAEPWIKKQVVYCLINAGVQLVTTRSKRIGADGQYYFRGKRGRRRKRRITIERLEYGDGDFFYVEDPTGKILAIHKSFRGTVIRSKKYAYRKWRIPKKLKEKFPNLTKQRVFNSLLRGKYFFHFHYIATNDSVFSAGRVVELLDLESNEKLKAWIGHDLKLDPNKYQLLSDVKYDKANEEKYHIHYGTEARYIAGSVAGFLLVLLLDLASWFFLSAGIYSWAMSI